MGTIVGRRYISSMDVLVPAELPPPAVELLRAAGHRVETAPANAFRSAISGKHAVITLISDRVDGAFLDAAGPSLRIVANFGVGYDHIDLRACAERNVVVTNTPGVLTEATAELTWALILAAARRVVEGDTLVRSGRWEGWGPQQLLGLQLAGSTLGVIGAGRIGTAVALRGVAFGMSLVYAHPRPHAELNAAGGRQLELDALLQEADVISLHAPMRPSNHHLLDRSRLGLIRPHAILVNTARGALIDEAALVEALRNRRIAAAGLDVYEHEPKLAAGLRELPNAVLLPHLGSATRATRERMSRMAAEEVIAVLAGRAPTNPVKAPAGA